MLSLFSLSDVMLYLNGKPLNNLWIKILPVLSRVWQEKEWVMNS